jgi:hypothetical protein
MSVGLIDQDCLTNKKDFFYDLDIMKIASYYKSKREITKLLLDPREYTQYTQTFFIKNRFDYKLFSELFKDKRITYRGYAFYGQFLAPLPDDIEKAIPDTSIYDTYLKFNDNLANRRIPRLQSIENSCHARLSKDGSICNTPIENILYKDTESVCLYDFNIFDLQDWREAMKPLQDKFLKLRFSPISDNLDDIIYVLENYKLNTENHLIIGKTLDEVELKEVITLGQAHKDRIRVQILKDFNPYDKDKKFYQINYAMNTILALKKAKTRIHAYIDQHDIDERTAFLNNISYWSNRNHSDISLYRFIHEIRKTAVGQFDKLAEENDIFKYLYTINPSQWEELI